MFMSITLSSINFLVPCFYGAVLVLSGYPTLVTSAVKSELA